MAANVGERAGVDAFVIETRVGRTAVAVVIAFQMDALRLVEYSKILISILILINRKKR